MKEKIVSFTVHYRYITLLHLHIFALFQDTIYSVQQNWHTSIPYTQYRQIYHPFFFYISTGPIHTINSGAHRGKTFSHSMEASDPTNPYFAWSQSVCGAKRKESWYAISINVLTLLLDLAWNRICQYSLAFSKNKKVVTKFTSVRSSIVI